MKQFPLDLPPGRAPALGRADFLVSGCNEAALGAIERWPGWPAPTLVLSGPPRSGKSHLAQLWCGRAGGRLVPGEALAQTPPDWLARQGAVAADDADRAPEEALLHLYNCCVETGASLLVVAREAPASWPFALADLASRLRAAPAVAIAAPDDRLLAGVLVKHFADRQLRVAPEVVSFLLPRMERSFAAAAALAVRLDTVSLGLQRPITIALARRVLEEPAGQLSLPSDFGVA
jgi:chromosomal replication initiation ATPase DnaA